MITYVAFVVLKMISRERERERVKLLVLLLLLLNFAAQEVSNAPVDRQSDCFSIRRIRDKSGHVRVHVNRELVYAFLGHFFLLLFEEVANDIVRETALGN